MEINEENCKFFAKGRKVMKLRIITLQFQLNKQNIKQTNKQSNQLTLTISYEKIYLIKKTE